jgi:Fe-S-cluster containining protein
MEDKFKCSMCGFCCSNLGRKNEDETIEEDKLNLLPFFRLHPEKEGLHLYDFEYKKIRKLAEDKGIRVKFFPFMVLFDLNSDKVIVIDWIMEEKICPFMKDNKCTIYTDRPMICRRYPVFMQSGKNTKIALSLGACHNNIKNKDSVQKIKEFYGDLFDYAVEDYEIQQKDKIIVLEAIKKKIIRPAVRYRLDFLRKRAENAEKISIYDL